MQTRSNIFGRSLLMIGLCQGLFGCAPVTSELTGAAVEGAVESVEEPQTLAQLEEIADDPRFQDAVEQTTAAATRGAVEGIGIDGQDLSPSVEELGAALTRGVVAGLDQGLDRMQLPEPGAVVGNVIDSALASAAAPENLARAQLVASDLSEAVVRSITASLADGIREDIRPALTEATNGAAPLVTTALDNTGLRQALGGMAYEISRESALGVDDAMTQIAQENRAKEEGVLGRMSIVGWALLASLAVLLLGAIVAIVILAIRNSKSRNMIAEEHRNREHMLTSLIATSSAAKEGGLDDGTRSVLLRYLGAEDTRGRQGHGDEGPSHSSLAPAE